MPGDLPADVSAVLEQLLAEGQTAIASEDLETARDVVSTAETVSENKLPEGQLRSQLLHGCQRTRVRLDEADAETAREYLEAMERRLDAVDSC